MRRAAFTPADAAPLDRDLHRREGAEKALFHAPRQIKRLPVRDPQPGETPAEWQGAYRALVEAQLDLLAGQIARGELSLTPLRRSPED